MIVIVCVGTALALLSCYEKPKSKTKGEVMQERLEERLERWKNGTVRNCRESVLEEAAAIVDSTMLAQAKMKRDTSGRPQIPGRPEKPAFVAPNDSTPVRPLLSKEPDTSSGTDHY